MPSFIDYNTQLLNYKNAAADGFIDATDDQKSKVVSTLEEQKEGYELKLGDSFPIDKTNLENRLSENVLSNTDENLILEKASDIYSSTLKSGEGIDQNTAIDLNSSEKLRDSKSVPETIIIKEYDPTKIETDNSEKTIASKALPENIIVKEYDVKNFPVSNLTNEKYAEKKIADDGTTVEDVLEPSRAKLQSAQSVPELVNIKGYDVSKSNKLESIEVYQPVGSTVADLAEVAKRSVSTGPFTSKFEPIKSDDLITSYTSREEKSITNNSAIMFLYSVMPYIVGKTAESVSSMSKAVTDVGTSPGIALGVVRNVLDTLNFLSYFSTDELLMSLTATPFTLGFLGNMGVQLKDKISSVKWARTSLTTLSATGAEKWDIKESVKNLISNVSKNNKDLSEIYKDIYSDIGGNAIPPYVTSSGAISLNNYEKILKDYRDEISNRVIENNSKNFGTSAPTKDPEISTVNNPPEQKEFDDRIKELQKFKNKISIGYINVYPSSTDDGIKSFKIPFQFSPTLTESAQSARWEGQNILHRQGQAFSYVQTEGQTLTLSTNYLILTDESNGSDVKDESKKNLIGVQDAFYSAWKPSVVQTIEKALRSLVLPLASNETNGDIKFQKPPMVKIVMDNSDSSIYGLLKYPLSDGKYYHRTYIITSVGITREAEMPYYLKDENSIDTHGFNVELQLTEIDHNYVGAAPDFLAYYKSYGTDINNFASTAESKGG
jgi:hypothetical protein